MKKILIATTALVATAGVAAADVNLSGYARFGVQYNEGASTAAGDAAAIINAARLLGVITAATNFDAAPTAANLEALVDAQDAADASAAALAAARAAEEDTTDIKSRFRLQVDVATTTDAGVGLNARQRFQAEENGGGTGGNGVRFGMTYRGLAVNVGNINGVIESTPNLYLKTNSAGVGLEGNGFHSLVLSSWTAYSSGGSGATNGVEVIYSANGLRLHGHDTDGATAYGASYSMGDFTFGAAYEDFDAGGSATLITAGMNIGNGWVALAHGIQESAAGVDTDKTAIKGGYDVAPGLNVYGFVASADAGDASGVGMSYDLGGGAAFDAGYTNTADSRGVMSAGIFFKF